MFGYRFQRSWQIGKESYAILKNNPSLGMFPVISGIAVLLASLPFVGGLFLVSQGHHFVHGSHQAFSAAHYALTFAMYFVNMFIVVFCNAALVACAYEVLQGRPTTIKYGFDQAKSRLPQIFTWAFIAATIGMILRSINERAGIVGTIVTSLIGMAWNLLVFFVVPVLVIERVGPIEAIKTSSNLVNKTWGERIIGGAGISGAIGVLALLILIPIAAAVALFANGLWPLGLALCVIALVYVLVLAVVGSALQTIYSTALYEYARTGTIVSGFQASSLQQAFQPKPASKFFGRNG